MARRFVAANQAMADFGIFSIYSPETEVVPVCRDQVLPQLAARAQFTEYFNGKFPRQNVLSLS